MFEVLQFGVDIFKNMKREKKLEDKEIKWFSQSSNVLINQMNLQHESNIQHYRQHLQPLIGYSIMGAQPTITLLNIVVDFKLHE